MTNTLDRALHVSPGDGRALWFTNNRITIKAIGERTGGAFSLWEAVLPAGASPPLHVHRHEDESFWVLEGTVTFRCGEETITGGPGTFVHLPRHAPHTFVAEEPARLLGLATPGGLDRYFVDAGREAENAGLPAAGPPDIALLKSVGERYGAEVVGPPLAPRAL
jgi:quercetin dioxygenase-like cupin family protein